MLVFFVCKVLARGLPELPHMVYCVHGRTIGNKAVRMVSNPLAGC